MSNNDRQTQIANLASTFARQSHAGDPRSFSEGIELGFKAGAAWADRNPANKWHDVSDEPTKKGYLLIQFGNAEYGTFRLRDIDVWRAWLMKNCYIIRWAYISDLLPKGGET